MKLVIAVEQKVLHAAIGSSCWKKEKKKKGSKSTANLIIGGLIIIFLLRSPSLVMSGEWVM